MPPPLTADGQVTYADGTAATRDQMAQDVSAFLTWAAEPELESRRAAGWWVVIFLIFATVLAYLAYQNVWATAKRSGAHHRAARSREYRQARGGGPRSRRSHLKPGAR